MVSVSVLEMVGLLSVSKEWLDDVVHLWSSALQDWQ